MIISEYISDPEAAKKWGISERWVRIYARKTAYPAWPNPAVCGWWLIPKDAEKPKLKRKVPITYILSFGSVGHRNRRLSFLCKDREEKFKDRPYNDKDKFMSAKHNMYEEASHGMG